MPSKEEINKYLTEELFGECWHEVSSDQKVYEDENGQYLIRYCLNCYKSWDLCINKNLDFFTWEGFGKLWEKLQTQEWWFAFGRDFMCEEQKLSYGIHYCPRFDNINPERFATAVYEFLKENN